VLLNYDKAKFMQFLPDISKQSLDATEFKAHKINSTNFIKFLGIIIRSILTLKEYVDYINSKLDPLNYMVHSLRPVLELTILKQIYFPYIHSVLNYGIMFWGNSPQKRIVRIIMETGPRGSCKDLFSKLGILTLCSHYIFSVHTFVV
jgi:hypothetical protein